MCSLYERAIEAVGSNYSCHQVWEKYIAFETALGAHQRAAALYGRALQSPLKGLDALLTQCVFTTFDAHLLPYHVRQGLLGHVASAETEFAAVRALVPRSHPVVG